MVVHGVDLGEGLRRGDSKGPCRACHSFKQWAKDQGTKTQGVEEAKRDNECPLDREELGHSTWNFLHTMAAYYPERPTDREKQDMGSFFNFLSSFYPCDVCAEHLRNDLQTNPPDVSSCLALSTWLCKLHNRVNLRLGKPEFNCSRVMERWKTGWLDGSCD